MGIKRDKYIDTQIHYHTLENNANIQKIPHLTVWDFDFYKAYDGN